MKEYKCGQYTYNLPETACVFCEHCADVFWDYIHGPYCIICNKRLSDIKGNFTGICKHFKSED